MRGSGRVAAMMYCSTFETRIPSPPATMHVGELQGEVWRVSALQLNPVRC